MPSTSLNVITAETAQRSTLPVCRQPAAHLSDFHGPTRPCGSCERDGSVFLLVLERKLQLDPEDDLALLQVHVLLDHLSYPKVVQSVCRGLHRLRCRVFHEVVLVPMTSTTL